MAISILGMSLIVSLIVNTPLAERHQKSIQKYVLDKLKLNYREFVRINIKEVIDEQKL